MFSFDSSSFHILNADRGLSPSKQRLYFMLNRLNNAIPLLWRPRFETRIFRCDFNRSWDALLVIESPSRKLSNLFWINLPWEVMQKELGEIHVFDTGCGTGRYGVLLQEFSDHRIAKYVGLDSEPREQWKAIQDAHPNITLKQGNASSIAEHIPQDTNLFVTQSALEHIEDDLLYFRQVHEFICKKRKNVIQIHLLPSPICLDLYGLHGVRQYTPRTIAKITAIFKDDSYSVLYQLGGVRCNSLHLEFITNPINKGQGDLRDTQTEYYDSLLHEAMEKDMAVLPREPSFYALVIHSFWKQKFV